MNTNDFLNLFQQYNGDLLVKGITLLLIGLFDIFIIIYVSQIRTLGRIVSLKESVAANMVQTVLYVYLSLAISLFFLALVIL